MEEWESETHCSVTLHDLDESRNTTTISHVFAFANNLTAGHDDDDLKL